MKECELYEKKKSKKVRCTACEHKCLISNGKTGICAVRKNKRGKLRSVVYGRAVSKNVDAIEKKPLFHFLPGTYSFSLGTFGCNFKCKFCQNYETSQAEESEEFKEGELGEEMSPRQVIFRAMKNRCKSISYTYNEPTVFIEYVKDIASLAQKKDLKNVMVTNGYMTKECFEYVSPYIDAMNVDLKSLSKKFYKENCKAKLEPVLETIKRAYEKGIHLEVSTMLLPGQNTSKKEIEKVAKFIASVDKNIPWHILRFFPAYKMSHKKETPIKTLEKAKKIGEKYLNHVYIGNTFDKLITLCPKCGEEVITRFNGKVENFLDEGKCPECGREITGEFQEDEFI